MEFVAARSGIGESTIWNYLSGKIPKNITKLPELAAACGCHPSELLTPQSRGIYELLLYEANEVLLDDENITERSLHIGRLSREIRMWEKFFEGLDADDDPDERSQALDDEAGKLFKPPSEK